MGTENNLTVKTFKKKNPLKTVNQTKIQALPSDLACKQDQWGIGQNEVKLL